MPPRVTFSTTVERNTLTLSPPLNATNVGTTTTSYLSHNSCNNRPHTTHNYPVTGNAIAPTEEHSWVFVAGGPDSRDSGGRNNSHSRGSLGEIPQKQNLNVRFTKRRKDASFAYMQCTWMRSYFVFVWRILKENTRVTNINSTEHWLNSPFIFFSSFPGGSAWISRVAFGSYAPDCHCPTYLVRFSSQWKRLVSCSFKKSSHSLFVSIATGWIWNPRQNVPLHFTTALLSTHHKSGGCTQRRCRDVLLFVCLSPAAQCWVPNKPTHHRYIKTYAQSVLLTCDKN